MQNLLTRENIVESPIESGDAGVILKLDGSFKIFSTGDLDSSNMTESQINQGLRLNALALALSVPQVMDVLLRMAADPTVVGEMGVKTGAAH